MKSKNIFLILLFFIFFAGSSCGAKNEARPKENSSAKAPYEAGETITYAIKNFGVKAGEATLEFSGLQKLNGQDAYLIIFKAKAVNFYDEEKIFADPKTFYPVKVERDLNIFGKKEKISEDYDEARGIIKITKRTSGSETSQTIEKKGPIDNIYCFIYRYRQNGGFKIGDSVALHLPTTDVKIDLVKKTNIKAGGQNYDAFFMQSNPAKYKLWFDTSDGKIPLRINGAVGISDTAMIMTSYKPSEKSSVEK